MSFLTPLYILGALAVVGPILFHLIRRTPKGEVPFSSLMFLAPTPPRLTRRSRLDNLLLLLLRAAALALLALAFARPFLRQAAQLDFGDVERRRIAVLIDTSASMRRGDLWTRAQALAKAAVADCRPADQLAVFAFDATPRAVVGFAQSAALDPARRRAVAEAEVARLEPSWKGTDLGQALVAAVAAIEDVADASEKAGRMPRRVVLISDLPQGSKLDALGAFEWPSDVELDLKTVADDAPNAGLNRLDDADATGPVDKADADTRRVRVANDARSQREKFTLVWVDDKGETTGKPTDVYVPPGESRVVRVPRPAQPATFRTLRLAGDAQPFDNLLYFAEEPREESTVLYLGPDAADDPEGLLYYLGRVFQDTPRRTVRIRAASPTEPLAPRAGRTTPLVILSGETLPGNVRLLREYARNGGTVLDVLTQPGRAEALGGLVETPPIEAAEATVKRDAMLGAIAFDHPLFAPLAGPQFNDFTKIHFWKYRRLDDKALGAARVLARFENGDPAVFEKPLGKGRLVVFASGWQPADSQLARSSKFVPLMVALLEARDPRPLTAASYLVGDPVPLPAAEGTAPGPTVRTPVGATVAAPAGGAPFAATDEPGIYTVEAATGPRPFAVNLDPLESKTAPLLVETLEQYGCRLARPSHPALDREHLRQMQNLELESRQKVWRWLILAAIGILIAETWLAGRSSAPRPIPAEA